MKNSFWKSKTIQLIQTNEDKFIRSTSYSPAIDSIKAMGINIDSLGFRTFTNGLKFEIAADTIEYQHQSTSGAGWYKVENIYGEFGDPNTRSTTNTFDPENCWNLETLPLQTSMETGMIQLDFSSDF